MFFSASLLSYIKNKDLDIRKSIKYFTGPSIALASISGLVSFFLFHEIVYIVYNSSISTSAYYIGWFVFLNIAFITSRPLLINFSKPTTLLILNSSVIFLSFTFIHLHIYSGLNFILAFMTTRAIFNYLPIFSTLFTKQILNRGLFYMR